MNVEGTLSSGTIGANALIACKETLVLLSVISFTKVSKNLSICFDFWRFSECRLANSVSESTASNRDLHSKSLNINGLI